MASIPDKKKPTGKLSIRCIILYEKIKIMDEVKRKMRPRDTAEEIKIGKAQEANVIKHETQLPNEYGKFPGKGFKHIKRQDHKKYSAINDILYSWFKNCESSGIYFKGLLLKEETTNIKKGLNQEVLNDFKASGKWLGKWKLSYGKCEKQISGSLATFLRLAINLP